MPNSKIANRSLDTHAKILKSLEKNAHCSSGTAEGFECAYPCPTNLGYKDIFLFRGVIDFRRYWWIFRSESRDALPHRQYKGAQVATISRLRKREGRQTIQTGGSAGAGASRASAGTASSHKNRLYTLVLSFFTHPPTSEKRKKETTGDELYAV